MNTSKISSGLLFVGSRYQAWFEKFFFEPTSPHGLALCRIWFYGYLTWIASKASIATWFNVPVSSKVNITSWLDMPESFWMPIGLFRWVSWPAFSPELIESLQWIWLISLICCCVGLCTRVSSVVAFALTLFIFGLPHNFGKVGHAQTLTVLATSIFMFSHSGAALSLDALLRRWLGPKAQQPTVSSEYQWPLRLMQAVMTVVFFAAGVAKLRASGLAWMFSDHMLYTCLRGYYIGQNPLFPSMGIWLAQYPLLCKIIAITTIWAELTAPLALISRRYKWLVIPSLFSMQVGIWCVMGIMFPQYLLCYLFWLPWGPAYDAVLRIGSRRTSTRLIETASQQNAPQATQRRSRAA